MQPTYDRTIVHINNADQLDDRLVFTKRQVVDAANDPVIPYDLSEENQLRALEHAALPFRIDGERTDQGGVRHIFVSTR